MAKPKSNELVHLANYADFCRCSNFFLRLLLLVCVLAIAIFISLVYPLLQQSEHNLQVNLLPGSSLTNRNTDAVALDHRARHSENKLAGLNETFLAYAASDPTEEQEKRKIKWLLEGNKVQYGNSRTRGSRRNETGNETLMLEVLRPRYVRFWPRFRQLLQIWSGRKKHDPLVTEDLMRTMKKTFDKFYKTQANTQERMDHESEQRYRTCAVVGNSGILLDQSFGSFIDSHDVVIRLNNAKLRGFEEFVGSKTTLSFVNSNVYHYWTTLLNCFCHPYGNIPVVLYLCQVQHLMDLAFCEPHQNAPVLVTDPRFDILCARLVKYYSVKNYVEVTGNAIERWAKDHHALEFHYSSGFQAVVLALGICEKVDILGFGKGPGKHHYHSNRTAELSLHDYAAEYLFYDDLALNRTSSIPFLSETGIRLPSVTIYKSKLCTSGCTFLAISMPKLLRDTADASDIVLISVMERFLQ